MIQNIINKNNRKLRILNYENIIAEYNSKIEWFSVSAEANMDILDAIDIERGVIYLQLDNLGIDFDEVEPLSEFGKKLSRLDLQHSIFEEKYDNNIEQMELYLVKLNMTTEDFRKYKNRE